MRTQLSLSHSRTTKGTSPCTLGYLQCGTVLRCMIIGMVFLLTSSVAVQSLKAMPTSITLMLTMSGKTVAQLFPDASGSVAFANLPDGNYKIEVNVNGKRFVLENDADNDGIADMVITTQRDASSANATPSKLVKTIRVLLTDKGKRKSLTMGEWSQLMSKPTSIDAVQSAIALELKVESNSIKFRVVNSTLLEEWKNGM